MILSLKENKIAITGTLRRYTREKAYSLIKKVGGIPKKKITTDTDILVVTDLQEYQTDKIRKAEKWGIEVICEADFYELIGVC